MLRVVMMDCGAKIGVGVTVFGRRLARRFRNPFFVERNF